MNDPKPLSVSPPPSEPLELLRQLSRDMGTVRSVLARKQIHAPDDEAQDRMLKRWESQIARIEALLPISASLSEPKPALEAFAGEKHGGRYRWERPALDIVESIKKHCLPEMEEEQGGWLLGLILDLTMRVRDETSAILAASPVSAVPPRPQWQPIKTAPKDGTAVLLLCAADAIEDGSGGTIERPAKCYIAHWWPEGTSWVDEHGRFDGPAYRLDVTGTWLPQDGGWFQPNEVTHWMPLPPAPDAQLNEPKPSAESELLAIRARLHCLDGAQTIDVLQSLLDDRDVAYTRIVALEKALDEAQAETRDLWRQLHPQPTGKDA